jgi:transcriptional activator HAC1
MAAMRLQSEQQFTRDCLTGVGACDRRDGIDSPSLEALMTLLWAIRVSEKERERISQPDMATDIKQNLSGLDEQLRLRKMEGLHGTRIMGLNRQKSLEGWRKAYNHDRT